MSRQEWINAFGDRLVEFLYEYDMSPSDLANAIKVERSTISKYINKKQMITVKNLVNMANVFRVTVDKLAYFGEPIDK